MLGYSCEEFEVGPALIERRTVIRDLKAIF